jgi:hypothetical protein
MHCMDHVTGTSYSKSRPRTLTHLSSARIQRVGTMLGYPAADKARGSQGRILCVLLQIKVGTNRVELKLNKQVADLFVISKFNFGWSPYEVQT